MRTTGFRRFLFLTALLVPLFINSVGAQPDAFHFVILGDRTGAVQPGVYEDVWKEVAEEDPAFVVTVGDAIEGSRDVAAESEWKQLMEILSPYQRFPVFSAPGNHDIWSIPSLRLYQKYTGHPPHYSFDFRQAHFTVLDNSRSEQLPVPELMFLEKDLEAHKDQPVKFVVFHRPSWLIDAALQNPHFPLHEMLKKYGVRYVISGHLHQVLDVTLEGITYLSMPSSGGHLRGDAKYGDGSFFGYAAVAVHGSAVDIRIKELKPPHGKGRVSELGEWRRAGQAVNAGER